MGCHRDAFVGRYWDTDGFGSQAFRMASVFFQETRMVKDDIHGLIDLEDGMNIPNDAVERLHDVFSLKYQVVRTGLSVMKASPNGELY